MCYERHLRRRREEDESREIWHDFEQTRPVADPDRPPEVTEPEPTDVRRRSPSRSAELRVQARGSLHARPGGVARRGRGGEASRRDVGDSAGGGAER